MVTFDDGFKNNYTQAFPVLMECGVPATIFLTTGHIGRGMHLLWTERVARLISGMKRPVVRLELGDEPRLWWLRSEAEREQTACAILKLLKRLPIGLREDKIAELVKQADREEPPTTAERYEFLTWDDARAMTAAGIEFGSHTVHHQVLSTLDARQRLEEVVSSKETIERELRQPCRSSAIPTVASETLETPIGACFVRSGMRARPHRFPASTIWPRIHLRCGESTSAAATRDSSLPHSCRGSGSRSRRSTMPLEVAMTPPVVDPSERQAPTVAL